MTDELKVLDQAVADCVSCIVSAYIAKNHVPVSGLPALIASVRAAVGALATGGQQAPAAADLTVTEAQIRKSITPDAIISFIDGKAYKVLKRHLSTHGLDPHSYRERYGLPANYPMVAPSYSVRRADISRSIRPERLRP